MKQRYCIVYVNEKDEMLSFETFANDWQELKDNIDKGLPKDTKYISGISMPWG